MNNSYVLTDAMGVIRNIVAMESEEAAKAIGARPYYVEAEIGEVYDYPGLTAARTAKEVELSGVCSDAITAGMDVETSQGTEHFSLQETDQINLTTAYNAVLSGLAAYPYHADGKLCRMFTAEEITAISNASIQHKLYHTTLCNHLLTWARRAESMEELAGITYTTEGLPQDLADNMAQVLAAAANV